MNVKYSRNASAYTLSAAQISRIKKQATMDAIKELERRRKDIIDRVSEDSLYLVLLTGIKALIDIGCDYDFTVEFSNRVADIVTSLNEDGVTLDSLEKEVDDFGITLKKECGSDIPEDEYTGGMEE